MKRFSVLYVDDEESNLRIFKDTFRRKFNVYTATSAKEGIEILERENIDLILSDQRMPEMTGVEFLKYTFERFPNTNRILVTGYTDFDAVENAINQARVFQYVQKPWSEENLLGIIEDALRIYRLEQENAKQKEDLIKAKIRAEESDLLKTEFLNNLSHEIRTPLNGIYGFTSMLSNPDITPKDRDHYVSIIQNCSSQLVSTIDHILAYSMLITKQIVPKYNQLYLNEFLSEIYDTYKSNAQKKGISFLLTNGLTNEESVVYTDKNQLTSIISNILDNAFKYTETGHVKMGYNLLNEKLIFRIEDTGVGIQPENQKKIFDRFSREEKSLTSGNSGLGLGLSIVKESADLIDAEISLESEKGKGTIFYISIPYNKQEPLLDKKAKIEEPPLYKKSKDIPVNILVAEDDFINYMYIETLLLQILGSNIVIHHAVNGKEAIEICESNSDLDLILMDIKMPVLNGYEAISSIKQFSPKIPIIAQTAYSSDDDKKKAEDAGCDSFIAKPIYPDELEVKIHKLLHTE